MASYTEEEVHDMMKDYYGVRVKCQDDMQTKVCISDGKCVPKHISEVFSMISPEVTNRYYGCGLAIPAKLEGMKILDLGSGSGRDCFTASKLVGQEGGVVGIDMTEELLVVSRSNIPYHMEKFGYNKPNIEFVHGYIENLIEAGLKENSYDIIISNCVINLSADKKAALSEAHKVLKVGGELYFSDMYVDRELPSEVRKNKILWGEGFSGSLWWKNFYNLAAEVGFSPPRLVNARPIEVDREDFKQIIGDAKYVAVTYRLFKLPEAKQSAMSVTYKGNVTANENELEFDHQNTFKTGKRYDVEPELATILSVSRFQNEFIFETTLNHNKEYVSCQVDPFEYLAAKARRGEKVVACKKQKAAICGSK